MERPVTAFLKRILWMNTAIKLCACFRLSVSGESVFCIGDGGNCETGRNRISGGEILCTGFSSYAAFPFVRRIDGGVQTGISGKGIQTYTEFFYGDGGVTAWQIY